MENLWNSFSKLSPCESAFPSQCAFLKRGCVEQTTAAEVAAAEQRVKAEKAKTEAAKAVGLSRGQTLRHVVLPQAVRVILPPTGNQYLNLTKNTSLAVAVGMSDMVQVGTTVFNQTGRTLPVVAIWMLFYLSCSLTISVVVNWFNVRMQLVER